MQIHLLVGTKKGAFIFSSDEARENWQSSELMFPSWSVHHLVGDPRNGNLYAAIDHMVYGSHVHRSADFGKTWQLCDPPAPQTPDEKTLKRIWHIHPGHADTPNVVWAGGDPGVLYKSKDGGESWQPVLGINQHPTRNQWQPGAGGMMVHCICHDPTNAQRVFVGISVAGVFRSDDGGETWIPKNKGVRADFLPEPYPEVGHCCHHLVMSGNPQRLYQQNHCGVYRSDDAGERWVDIGDGLPATFGFPAATLRNNPDTFFVMPQVSDEFRYTPEGKFRVYRTHDAGNSWQAPESGLPQENAFLTVHREAMTTDTFAQGGVYVGTTTGQLYYSRNEGRDWHTLHATLPPVYSVATFIEA